MHLIRDVFGLVASLSCLALVVSDMAAWSMAIFVVSGLAQSGMLIAEGLVDDRSKARAGEQSVDASAGGSANRMRRRLDRAVVGCLVVVLAVLIYRSAMGR